MSRIGVLMSPEPGNPLEVEGVLNPACARGADDVLYIYPRLVAAGNRSRIGRARVLLDGGVPVGVQREGVVLSPERDWERGARHGGTEDPRITRIERLGLWVMTYVAFGPTGPRPALAVSRDALEWERLGPLHFEYDDALGTDLNLYPNKDVVYFPDVVPGPDGEPSFAALHRPMWDLRFGRPGEHASAPSGAPDDRPSIWISYVAAREVMADLRRLAHLGGHRFVAGPQYEWEALKIGAGPPPIRTGDGWLVIHHGVSGTVDGSVFQPQQNLRYCAGAMLLDLDHLEVVLARTERPLLEPEDHDEVIGTASNVVFPTAVERIAGTDCVFYGMADSKIGTARLERVTHQGPS